MTEADTASKENIQPEEIPKFFLKEKPCLALITIAEKQQSDYAGEKAYGQSVANEIKTTYAHVVKIINRLENLGLVEKEDKGRKNHLTATDQGLEIALKVSELVQEIKKVDFDE